MDKQNDEIQRLNLKLKDSTSINGQLNDELNEKTEQICQLHSENSRFEQFVLHFYMEVSVNSALSSCVRLSIDLTKMVNEMKNGQDNESHLSMLLVNERNAVDAKNESLSQCEMLLKQCSEKNEEMNRKNATLAEDVSITVHCLYILVK